MTQPTPNVTDADVERVVRRDFPAERRRGSSGYLIEVKR